MEVVWSCQWLGPCRKISTASANLGRPRANLPTVRAMLAGLPTDLQIDLGTDGCNVGTLGPVNEAAATSLKICSGTMSFSAADSSGMPARFEALARNQRCLNRDAH